MVTYQFDVEGDTWEKWKDTVPRSKNLDERLRELIIADSEGRVLDAGAADTDTESPEDAGIDTPTPTPEVDREALAEALAGSGDVLERRVDAILEMYQYLREEGAAEKSDLLAAIDVEATGYDSAASVWSNMVKGRDTLRALPGVQPPSAGMSTWRYTAEHGQK